MFCFQQNFAADRIVLISRGLKNVQSNRLHHQFINAEPHWKSKPHIFNCTRAINIRDYP